MNTPRSNSTDTTDQGGADRLRPPEDPRAAPDVETDREVPGKHPKKPLPIGEVEEIEDDAKGG